MAAPLCVPASPRPALEVADIFRRFGPRYRRDHALSGQQLKVMRAIEACRTAALGGHIDQCDRCDHLQISYNSCGNRHCGKCQGLKQLRWIEARKQQLLPIEYFHVVFTLPDRLNDLVRFNARLLYGLLFKAASATLQAFAARHFKGRLGITAVLHTWGQNLSLHPHLHCIVTGGALSFDEQRWQRAPQGYLFPVRALSQVFRGKYLDGLRQASAAEALVLPRSLSEAGALQVLLGRLQTQDWVVYAKRPFAGPEQVVEYLGRYTHRVAMSNRRLVALDQDRIRFLWKDYRAGGQPKVMTLSVAEFIRRFLLHVLPRGFVRLRHYGLLANTVSERCLATCRVLLEAPMAPPAVEAQPYGALLAALLGVDVLRCPVCGQGRLQRLGRYPAGCDPPGQTMGQAA